MKDLFAGRLEQMVDRAVYNAAESQDKWKRFLSQHREDPTPLSIRKLLESDGDGMQVGPVVAQEGECDE